MIQKLTEHQTAKQSCIKIIQASLMLLATLNMIASDTSSSASQVSTSQNLFLHRAFSANIARELMMEGHIIKTDFDGFYSFFAATGAYQRSWDQNSTTGLGALPFWSGTNSMSVGINGGPTTAGGSTINPISSLDAYQFGLGTVSTNGQIQLNPIVYQGGSDFLLYCGSSTNDPGMFIKIKAPLGIIGINPQLTQPVLATSTAYPAGAIQASSNAAYQPATSMAQAFAGTTNTANSGDFLPMQYGLIDGVQKSGAKFGDIELTLGYNFVSDDDHLFGLGFRASGPSGNKPTCQYALEPIFGRGSSWGVGGYLVGEMKLWESHEDKYFSVNIMGTVLHLLDSNTIRSYDLTTNGAGSKYLLVADYNANTYQGNIQNLINLSTLASQSGFSAEGDAAIAFQYVSHGWEVDLGYNFWGRTKENLTITGEFPQARYAILGRQYVGTGATDTKSTLCQPSATISTSINALGGAGAANANSVALDATVPANRIAGNSAFDVAAAEQASASTSKIFTKAAYSWLDSHTSPYIGLLGEFEISTSKNNALNQWSIALVGGLYF